MLICFLSSAAFLFVLHYANQWHQLFTSVSQEKLSTASAAGLIPAGVQPNPAVLFEGRAAEFFAQPLNRLLEEIEGYFTVDNDVALELPALKPLVFNINNSFCEVRFPLSFLSVVVLTCLLLI